MNNSNDNIGALIFVLIILVTLGYQKIPDTQKTIYISYCNQFMIPGKDLDESLKITSVLNLSNEELSACKMYLKTNFRIDTYHQTVTFKDKYSPKLQQCEIYDVNNWSCGFDKPYMVKGKLEGTGRLSYVQYNWFTYHLAKTLNWMRSYD